MAADVELLWGTRTDQVVDGVRVLVETVAPTGVGHAPQEQAPDVVGPLVGAFVGGIGR